MAFTLKKMSLKTSFIIFSFIIVFLSSCKSGSINTLKHSFNIKYLDEYVIYNDSIFKDSKIGGLSGIEYQENDQFYMVCDDAKNPRYYNTSIRIKNKKIDTVIIDQVLTIKDPKNQFLSTNVLDLEAIQVLGKNHLVFTSEGTIKKNYNPTIFITDTVGNYQDKFTLPSYFLIDKTSKNQPRHNGVFEGLANDIKHKGYWAALELPLELDGEEPSFHDTGAPVRITHFNIETKKADYQFTYPLDKLTKDPKDKFGVNGVTDLLQLTEKQFIILERAYSAGYGTQGNTVRIYISNIEPIRCILIL